MGNRFPVKVCIACRKRLSTLAHQPIWPWHFGEHGLCPNSGKPLTPDTATGHPAAGVQGTDKEEG